MGIKSIIARMLGIGGVTVKRLREYGAKVGDDVELYSVTCSRTDATCLEIGNHVTLSGVRILTHDASPKRIIGHDCNRIGRVVIGDNVFIGQQTIILPNVRIGDNCIIGAGSVVTKSIPGDSVAAGNPARVICTIMEYKRRHLENMKDESRVYFDLHRDRMSEAERDRFNAEIDGRIVYALERDVDP